MGTLIRLVGASFNNPDLPVVGLPYTGIRDGLMAAHHFYGSLEESSDLSGNRSDLIQIGNVEWFPTFLRAGNGYNGFVSMASDLASRPNDFTICAIVRQNVDMSTYGMPINTYSTNGGSAGANIMIKSGGVRPQAHISQGPVMSGAEMPSTSTNWEVGILTAASNGPGADLAWHQPKYGHKWVKTVTEALLHQSNYGGHGSRWLIGFSDSAAAQDTVDVAYVAIFNRALSDSEVATQYASMKAYAEALGIGAV